MSEYSSWKASDFEKTSASDPIDQTAMRFAIESISLLAILGLCLGYAYVIRFNMVGSQGHAAFAIGLVGFVASFVMVRRFKQTKLAFLLLVVSGGMLTFFQAYMQGGVSSPYAIWFAIIPLLLGILVSPRSAIVGGVIAAVLLMILGVLGGVGYLPRGEIGPSDVFMISLNVVIATIFSSGCGYLMSRALRNSAQRIFDLHSAETAGALQLADSRSRFAAGFSACPDAIVIVDESGRIIEFNPAAVAMFERPTTEIRGELLEATIIPERLRKAHIRGFRRAREGGDSGILGMKTRTAALDARGEEFPVELVVESMSISGRRHFIGFIRDITRRELLETELDERKKELVQSRRLEAIGRLAGGIAHDFNYLLMAVNGYSELLLSRDGDAYDEETLESLGEIRAAGLRAASLTRQLLVFSRNTDTSDGEVVAPNKLVEGLLGILAQSLPASVRLSTDIVGETWPVRASGVHLEQAILNMILNAADSMADGGRLSVRTLNVEVSHDGKPPMPSSTNGGVQDARALKNVEIDEAGVGRVTDLKAGQYSCVLITDTGSGMDQVTLDRIFEPFFSTKSAEEGTGLGLSMARETIYELDGSIAVVSEAGAGSVFGIFLPKYRGEEASWLPTEEEEDLVGHDEIILIVEDEDAVRRLVSRTLVAKGFKVIEAKDGVEGYEKFLIRGEVIELVLTDIVMPKLGGVHMIKKMRMNNPDLKVIYMSGYSENELKSADLDSSRTAFIPKPFQLNDLINSIAEMIASPK